MRNGLAFVRISKHVVSEAVYVFRVCRARAEHVHLLCALWPIFLSNTGSQIYLEEPHELISLLLDDTQSQIMGSKVVIFTLGLGGVITLIVLAANPWLPPERRLELPLPPPSPHGLNYLRNMLVVHHTYL